MQSRNEDVSNGMSLQQWDGARTRGVSNHDNPMSQISAWHRGQAQADQAVEVGCGSGSSSGFHTLSTAAETSSPCTTLKPRGWGGSK